MSRKSSKVSETTQRLKWHQKKEDIDTVQLEFFKVAKNALKNNDGPVQESFSPNAAFGRYIATELDQLSPQL